MTTEEIEKAVKDYADSSTLDSYLLLKLDFRNGVEYANKHWQEKTRWIPVEERLPEISPLESIKGLEVGYPVLVKVTDTVHGDCYYVATLHQIANDKPYWMLNSAKQLFGVTHWKEIE